ncbi:MAG: hypothetical protein J5801_07755 [Bacteroidales bacterium]|nr:hypothetical protein [Bacteroidales bacterium]
MLCSNRAWRRGAAMFQQGMAAGICDVPAGMAAGCCDVPAGHGGGVLRCSGMVTALEGYEGKDFGY